MTDVRKTTGALGEERAAAFLALQGYVILAKNFRARTGEVDIIAEDRETLVFVEVKTRRGEAYGRPEEAVDYRKQRRIIAAARWYVHRYNCADRDCRFDVVAVELDGSKDGRLTHIQHAFIAE
jgi:putative endonuclease